MAVYEKWQSERYSIGCKVWEARCPNCHDLVESANPISSNYRFCPYCGFDMKSNIEEWDRKGETSKLTLDEAIELFLKVAEQNEKIAIMLKNYKEIDSNFYKELTAEKAESDCLQCATDHRQLAEWLTDYKKLRSIVDACNILAVDAFAVEKLCKELEEAKRLLKVAVEDIHELLCDRKSLDDIGQSCNVCSYIDNCPCCNRCDIIPELRTWRHADEALALIGEEGENDAE